MSAIPRRTYLSTFPYVPFYVRNLMVVPKEPRNSSRSSTKISKILLGMRVGVSCQIGCSLFSLSLNHINKTAKLPYTMVRFLSTLMLLLKASTMVDGFFTIIESTCVNFTFPDDDIACELCYSGGTIGPSLCSIPDSEESYYVEISIN